MRDDHAPDLKNRRSKYKLELRFYCTLRFSSASSFFFFEAAPLREEKEEEECEVVTFAFVVGVVFFLKQKINGSF